MVGQGIVNLYQQNTSGQDLYQFSLWTLLIHFSFYQDCRKNTEGNFEIICNSGPNIWMNTLRPRQNGRLFQTIFSNAFSWMKMYEFRLRFHWSSFLISLSTIFQHWFRWWLGADQATSHYLNHWWLFHRRMYASLGLDELREKFHWVSNQGFLAIIKWRLGFDDASVLNWFWISK